MFSYVIKERHDNANVVLCLRHWDGIDKPNYSSLIELRPEEYEPMKNPGHDFKLTKEGRFRHFLGDAEYKWDTINVQIPWRERTHLLEWIGKNVHHGWRLTFSRSLRLHDKQDLFDGEFWFEDTNDALKFKLTCVNNSAEI